MPVLDPERLAQIKKLRECGYPLSEIGQKFGITKERVRQLLELGYHDASIGTLVHRPKLASALNVSVATIMTLERKGLIQPIRRGFRYFYTLDDVEKIKALIAEQKKKPAAARVELTCRECGKIFTRPVYQVRPISPGKFCSKHCQGKYLARNYGFLAHPENKIRREHHRKYDYEKVCEVKRSTGYSSAKISVLMNIPRPTVLYILKKGGLGRQGKAHPDQGC